MVALHQKKKKKREYLKKNKKHGLKISSLQSILTTNVMEAQLWGIF